MPSGAKRRKAAKKKKDKTQTAISNGNGEVKVVESDGGENSSPASQDFEPQQNPFTKDDEKQPSVGKEAVENQKDGDLSDLFNEKVVEIARETKAGVDGPKDSNGKLNGEREPEMDEEQSNIVAETESFGEEVVQVEDSLRVALLVESNGVVTEKAVQVRAPEIAPVVEIVGPAPAESKSEKNEEKVHPSETFSDFQETGAERLPSSNTKLGQPSEETVGRLLQQSDVQITNSVWHAGSSDAQQSAEKEPLLRPAPRPVDKTSWTGCCGLLELFTGSSR